MKKRITKILGVVLSLALLSSLAMIAAPVAAADGPGQNKWGPIALPAVVDGADVDLIAKAADGTLFASVYKSATGDDYIIYKSTDGGWTWKATEFSSEAAITAIVTAPNWGDNDTVYVGTADGQVFRCTDAGDATPILLRQIVDSMATPATIVHDMDLWTDGGSIWIMVATDIDVLVMEDALFSEWIDMDLTISFDGVHTSQDGTVQDDFAAAYVCRFAPDFDQSGLIWTIIVDATCANDVLFGDAWIAATISPGQWGQVVNSVEISNDGLGTLRPEVDLDFADYYSSTSAPILFAAMNFDDSQTGDGLFLVEGGFTTNATVATNLEVNGSTANIDFQSVQVSGEVIMAGEYWNANVWISANGGDTFAEASKPPTGTGQTQVLMAPGAFDPDEGVAYAATRGTESAFSYTSDGGDTWNQIGFVDTDIDNILDLAFGSTILLTDDWGGPESVWRADDITAEVPNWERVYSDYISDLYAFRLVEYAMDGSVLMLFGRDGGNSVIMKSTDNGQTWNNWRTLPGAMGEINDWVVYDSATIFAACDNGFYGTTRFGPAKQRLIGDLHTIAVQPGFDPNDPDLDTLVVGGASGDIFASADAGNTFGAAESVGNGNVHVAFDQLDAELIYYATSASEVGSADIDDDDVDDNLALEDSEEDTAEATGFSGIWVAPDNALYAIGGDTTSTPVTGGLTIAGDMTLTTPLSGSGAAVTDLAFSGIDVVFVSGTPFTSEPVDPIAVGTDLAANGYNSVSGIIYITDVGANSGGYFEVTLTGLTLDDAATPFVDGETVEVAEGTNTWDVTLVPPSTPTPTPTPGADNLFRLLLGEDYNIWEMEAKDGAMGIWGFSGSNFVFTVVGNTALYGLEDTLSGKVQGVTVSNIGETTATVSWTAMTGAELYEVLYIGIDDTVVTDDTSKTLTGLSDNTKYTVQVRVATDEDFQSRWSTAVSFTTLQAIAQPENLVPEQGMQNAPLLPSFVWTEISNAVEYEFQLSTDPAFGSMLVDETLEITAYTLETELAYDTNHYWRVRAVSDTGTKSTWCFSNFHTRTKAIPPVTIEPPPTPTIILPTPQVTVIPPDVDITLPAPQVTVIPPAITVDVPPVVTVTQQPVPTLTLPVTEDPGTPAYIWVIVGIGALLTIAVIVLIIRTRRVV